MLHMFFRMTWLILIVFGFVEHLSLKSYELEQSYVRFILCFSYTKLRWLKLLPSIILAIIVRIWLLVRVIWFAYQADLSYMSYSNHWRVLYVYITSYSGEHKCRVFVVPSLEFETSCFRMWCVRLMKAETCPIYF